MKKLPVLRVRYILLFDLCGILLSYAAAFVMRFEPAVSVWPYLTRFEGLLWLSLLVRIPVYAAFGLYNHLWRYAGTRELRSILAAGTLSSILIAAGNRLILPFLGYASCESRAILLLDWLLNLAFLSATRMCIRMGQEWASARERRANANSTTEPHSVLVVGAGETGARVLRELSANRDLGMTAVGLVDDDPKKWGMRVHGVPVLGSCEDLPQILKQRSVDEVIVAMPSASGRVLREVKRVCKEAGLPIRVMPGMEELLDGTVSVKQLREVQLEDLLRRDPVVTNQAGVRAYIEGARVLVTGAGGSIGSELCRQIARQNPELLLLLGHGENSIFLIERELRKRFPKTPVRPVIADVRDGERIEQIIQRYRPEVIFHAAAHKHVPLMECNPAEAITNNVLGTQAVLRAAEQNGVSRFVMISTDKAVNPSSIMGASKRVAEMLVQETAKRTGRPYVAVRFGNVLGSRGSAVPIFKEQIAAGGPVTITHPEMRRYFMTIPEAVQLVLQAALLGKDGEVFMLDMGEPIKLVDLVTDLIELSGLTPGEDIEIVYTGIRPGEKLYEELLMDSEHYVATPHQKIFVSRSDTARTLRREELSRQIATLADFAYRMDNDSILSHLQKLVPEFQHDCGRKESVAAARQ